MSFQKKYTNSHNDSHHNQQYSDKPKHFKSDKSDWKLSERDGRQHQQNRRQNTNVTDEEQGYRRGYERHDRASAKAEKTMNVTNGNDGFITISLQEYVSGINDFESSMDALAICNQLGVSKETHWTIAVKSAIKYLETLRGNTSSKKENDTLFYYKIGISNNIRKNIAYIKWILYANAKHRNFDDEFAGLIGLLAGVCLYVNEQDLINKHTGNQNSKQNAKQTENLANLCKAYCVDEF